MYEQNRVKPVIIDLFPGTDANTATTEGILDIVTADSDCSSDSDSDQSLDDDAKANLMDDLRMLKTTVTVHEAARDTSQGMGKRRGIEVTVVNKDISEVKTPRVVDQSQITRRVTKK